MNFWRRIGSFFANIGHFLAARCRLFLYFFFFIGVFGNFGTVFSWVQWFFQKENVTGLQVVRNFATYTIAISWLSFVDIQMRERDEGEDGRTGVLIHIILLGFAVFGGGMVLWLDASNVLRAAAISSASLASILWFVAHWDDPNLVDSDSYSTLGGENPVSR